MNILKDKRIILPAVLACSSATGLLAQWSLIENWEALDVGVYQGKEAIEALSPDFHTFNVGALMELNVATGIDGIGGDKAAWFWYGERITSTACYLALPLAAEVPVGETATIYFRLWRGTDGGNWHVMTSKVAANEFADGVSLYGEMATIVRSTGSSTDAPRELQAHTGGYTVSTPNVVGPAGEWREFWMVVYNLDSPLDGDGWELYVKAPNDPAPAIVTFGGDNPFTRLTIRNKSVSSLKSFILHQNSSIENQSVYLIDDIYQSSGKNLETPGSESDWCGMVKLPSGDVDTGSFLGWIYTEGSSGSGWVYSYSLEKFVYVASCPAESGSWVYVSK